MQSILYITGHFFFSTVIKPIEKEKKARKGFYINSCENRFYV